MNAQKKNLKDKVVKGQDCFVTNLPLRWTLFPLEPT
jgi:hypothetical protein